MNTKVLLVILVMYVGIFLVCMVHAHLAHMQLASMHQATESISTEEAEILSAQLEYAASANSHMEIALGALFGAMSTVLATYVIVAKKEEKP
jgi:sulfite exporter TauE/SafE